MTTFKLVLALTAVWYLVLSVAAFAVYGIDKRKATRGTWRIKERTLHLLESLGGWPGAFVAQRYFHHKTRKFKFLLIFCAIVVLHALAWSAVIYLVWRQ